MGERARIDATEAPAAISGIEAMRGTGAARAQGFWSDAWGRVLGVRTAVASLWWIVSVAVIAVIAPLIANAQPLWIEHVGGAGGRAAGSAVGDAANGAGSGFSPLWRSLTATDLLLLVGAPVVVLVMMLPLRLERSRRLSAIVIASIVVILGAALVEGAFAWLDHPDRSERMVEARAWITHSGAGWRPVLLAFSLMVPLAIGASFLPFARHWWNRALVLLAAIAMASVATGLRRSTPPMDYDALVAAEADGRIRTTATLIPWSPDRSRSELITVPPGRTVREAFKEKLQRLDDDIARVQGLAARATESGRRMELTRAKDDLGQLDRQKTQLTAEWKRLEATPFADQRFILGTDSNGVDVLSQLIWACRLSLSVGFVSTGIALLIGVTVGALMGYFGGWVDLVLFRIVEIFMSIPVLFLLIVAAAVLPRNTYVMMAIIGCVSWTGAARFTRAEFLKLRGQDFVQSCRAVGLPLPSILFRHMLPNGVTPVLVDASFAIAAAILAEATLSFLGLGPDNQASWGKLLAGATASTGTFIWWLAIFPGFVIFLSVLSYNTLGGSLRDAIDPKLRKAAH